MSEPNIQEAVKQKYGEAANRAASGGTASCGGGAELSCCDPITKDLYNDAEKAGIENVEFLKGAIENVPLPDNSVDVIISNCVINLSGDKDRVLREAFRVLKPGGRFAISDVVVRGEVPADIRKGMELWVGCIAGALEEYEYRDKLYAAGFESVDIEPTRVYKIEEAREFLASAGLDVEKVAPLIDGKFISAFVRATKPARRGNVVGPSCRS